MVRIHGMRRLGINFKLNKLFRVNRLGAVAPVLISYEIKITPSSPVTRECDPKRAWG